MNDWQPLLEKLRATNAEILRVAPFRDFGLVPNPGASGDAIRTAEERIGARLPPSYRAFLAKYDGWPRFFEGASLLGTACLGRGLYDDFARAAFSAAETPEPELGPPTRRRQHSRLLPFGADLQSTTLFAFNREVKDESGEYEVIAWINEIGIRRPSFASFLELLVELAESDLADHEARSVTVFRRSA